MKTLPCLVFLLLLMMMLLDSESDDNKNECETALENYLTQTNYNFSSQSMASTKQTARKSDSKG